MKTIAFYVTDRGFGHLTRSLALIAKILQKSDHQIYLACGSSQVEYATVFLNKYKGRVIYKKLKTDCGTRVKENSFEIDINKTVDKINEFLGLLDGKVAEEVESLKDLSVSLVICDISIIGIKVAKQLGIKVVGITNYTYYHRYQKLGIDMELIKPFLDAYNQLDELYQLAYADDMSYITCPKTQVGMIARKINQLAVADMKTRYWPSAFLSIGQIARVEKIHISFTAGNIYATGNLNIDGNAHVIKLPARVGHSQDYIAASSLAIIKPGWSQVAECMISGIPFGIIDVNPIEDGEITEKLLKENACFYMEASEAENLNIKKLNMRAATTNAKKVNNDAGKIAEMLIGLVN